MALQAKSINPDRVAVYIRWSTEDQGEGTTLEVQRDGCKHYVLSQGWNFNEHLIYVDEGYSGGSLERPAMTKLREVVKRGHVDCVVVYKLDRLSRSVVDTVNLVLEEWEDLTYVKSARDPIDTSSPTGKMFFYMLASYAEWERSVIKERTWSGKVKRAQEGKNPGYKPPYGYRTGDLPGQFVIVPEEAAIVQRIFDEYTNGKGVTAIAFGLNGEGLLFRKGKPWQTTTIAHMLQNETYIGKLVYGKLSRNKKRNRDSFWVRNEEPLVIADNSLIPPILDKDLFKRVQTTREGRNPHKSGVAARALSSPHLLTGLLKCRNCGHSFVGDNFKGNDSFAYYKCLGVKAKGSGFCGCGAIQQGTLDSIVTDRIRQLFLTKKGKAGLVRLLVAHHLKEQRRLQAELAELATRQASLIAQLDRIERDYRDGELSAARYDRLTANIEQEQVEVLAALAAKKEALEDLQAKSTDVAEIERFAEALDRWDTLDIAERKALLRNWVREIRVFKAKGKHGDLTVEVFYRWSVPEEVERTGA